MATLAPLNGTGSSSKIANSYIVSFKDDVEATSAMATVKKLVESAGGENTVKNEFNIGKFHAFSATMDDQTRDKVRALPTVKYVEYDQVVTISS